MATPPRQVLPNQLFYVTARTVTRSMRLRPDPRTVQTAAYCLAVVASRYRRLGKLVLHEFVFMSNHYHILGTDVAGCLPDFVRDLNALLSRALNALRGLSGANFEKGYGLVRVLSGEKALEHAAYTLANPVAAGLVARATDWPGLSSVAMEYDTPLRVDRPAVGLWSGQVAHVTRRSSRSSNRAVHACRTRLPEHAELVIDRPDVLPELTDAELRAEVKRRLAMRERESARERRRRRRKVLGARKAARVHYLAVPGREELFVRNPTFSGVVDEARRAMAAAVKAFRRAYRIASRRFREGVRDVLFPAGTWLYRVRYQARCEAAAPP
ncbi:MAG: hypothetical protein D6705_18920 [Deltaproteobacteria bacterium]|nr:MAG: hypothetical protein D6705_18920 [Deltaproteobacteria bacterium]